MNARVHASLQELSGILVSLGVSEGAKLASALDIGGYLGQIEGLQLLAAGERQRLGALLQAAQRLSREQLDGALLEQSQSGMKIGEILMQRGLLSARECELVLAFQQRQCGHARAVTKLHLGNVLVATREVTREQLADALHRQSVRGGRLGEALVAAGQATEPQIKRGLQLQRTLVAAVLIAAMALAAPFSAKEARASNDTAFAPGSVAGYTLSTGEEERMQKVIRLLITDDREIVRAALRTMFEREPDITVVAEAGDGEAAIKRVRELSPDLVLMDISMPGVDGIEATRRIMRESPATRVLVFSSHMERRLVAQMIEYGALGYVSKAAGARELLQGVRTVAAGQLYLCPEAAVLMERAGERGAGTAGGAALAPREIEVLQLIAKGDAAADIATRLALAPGTVAIHQRNILRKLGLRNVDELRQYALRAGLIAPPAA